ncbi:MULTISPECIES: ABC-F family ATP-binding cassette domain-containing protein [unclassified Oceanispirochaeta]|uniref:ABC-F family ATP-binding cassette domain-containing protein n=1 Tax=unclassified Oceanispirochaeta TaxID=2635722 RepID=UPI000E091A3F|nr:MULTISPECIES: ABC-F family ATP-binding cassette domain-containing protein [unclassified Oceanispirochaeta]MBF9014383.1 ABC-F family ATP-binding cassette domain-containing protein [Oceanispirochaeta sp. M2]NPD71269.1 ABC-F family ATP-binding cassette domain-containing protein [Oceanispirochaeta sp. M1]RDG33652.1 ABC transporter ATP-binding protein [Oceanispirochaeta sp. M1]
MSAFVQLSGVSLAFGDRDILKNIHLNLSHSSRVALAGANGSGKTTFMKVICGEISADTGDRSQSRNARIGYLPQSGLRFRDRSLREEVEQAYLHIQELETEAVQLAERMADSSLEEKTIHNLAERHHEIQEQITSSGYYEREAMIYRVLLGLGFLAEDMERETSSFSGGWQMRIALARILLEMPDILLLDEPTNYLDLEARDWLEDFLQRFPGGVLVVSHDRYFLDKVTKETAELFQGGMKIYKGNYSAYESRRKLELVQLEAAWKQQQEEIARIEDFIRRFRYSATKGAQAQSRVKMLEKMERIEIPSSMKRMHFHFPPPPHSGRKVMSLEAVCKSYGDHQVLKDVNLEIAKGDRLNLAGMNGAGKSTLMRIISGEDKNYTGSLRLGTDVKIGYFSQDQELVLDPSKSVLETLEANAPTELIPKLRGMLGAFLFSDDDIFKKCAVLSGGEKNRLALLKLLLEPVNLLVMDEPTNHLDLTSKDVLLEAMKSYEGTLVFVSHDRYFIEALAGSVMELTPGKAEYFDGDYAYYRWKKETRATEAAGSDQSSAPMTGVSAATAKLSREEEKKLKADIRRLERREDQLMEELDVCETAITAEQEKLASPEVYSNAAKAKAVGQRITELEGKQHELTQAWEEAAEELAGLIG